jgi:hypothetical protein
MILYTSVLCVHLHLTIFVLFFALQTLWVVVLKGQNDNERRMLHSVALGVVVFWSPA